MAATGCPGSEDVEFTILSEYFNRSMFQWTKDGIVQLIPEFGGFGLFNWFQNADIVADEEQAFGQVGVSRW